MEKNQDGFTILEMIIVLSIIALVFLLTLPNEYAILRAQ